VPLFLSIHSRRFKFFQHALKFQLKYSGLRTLDENLFIKNNNSITFETVISVLPAETGFFHSIFFFVGTVLGTRILGKMMELFG
jgi:hypothetical protein